MVKFNAKNVEIYIGQIVDTSAFDPAGRGNDVTLAKYIDDQITASNIINFKKISNNKNEVSVEPAENTVDTRNYFGSTSTGAQNSDTEVVVNQDVDIKLSADEDIESELIPYGLSQDSITNSLVNDYKSFTLGNLSTDTHVLLIRIKRLLNGTYYFRNIVVSNPIFKKVGGFSGSSEDSVISNEYTLLSSKSQVYIDFYNSDTDEDLNFE